MGELETKITDILNSPEDMQKIINIARSFTGGSSSSPEGDSPSSPPPPLTIPEAREETKEIEKPVEEAEDTEEAEDVQESEDVEEAAGEDDSAFDFLDNLDINPDMMKTLGAVMGGLSSGNHSRELLDGIIPLLKPERQEQLTKAIKLAGMAKMALGLFGKSSGGD